MGKKKIDHEVWTTPNGTTYRIFDRTYDEKHRISWMHGTVSFPNGYRGPGKVMESWLKANATKEDDI